MGKSKARRSKNRGCNPVGIPSLKELEETEELVTTNFETGTVESVIEKLQSRSADDKECAAFTIANMASNPSFLTVLLQNKVIRIASPLLIDRNPSVRHAIAGCLRNIAACGDHSVCQAMVDQDIMTSLVSLMQQYKEPWTPVKPVDDVIDSKAEIFLEACNLLWSLCESSNTALDIFNKRNLISVLLPCLNIEVYGLQIPLAVAQCLHTVSEDNPEVSAVFSQPLIQEHLKVLMSLTPSETEHILLKTLAAGVLLNISSESMRSDLSTNVLEAIATTLDEPITPAINLLSEQIASHKAERLNRYHEEKDLEEKLCAVDKSLKALDYLLLAKQISLELLANIFFGEDPNELWEDVSNSDTSEETGMDIDDSEVAPAKLGLLVPCEIHGLIVNAGFLDKVLTQIVSPSDDTLSVLSINTKAKDIIKRLSTVRCRALLCLSNMVGGLDLEDLGGASKIFDLWINIANLLFKNTGASDVEQLEAATSSMRAVLQKLAEADCSSQFGNMTESDLELLINICQQTQVPTIKVNIIRGLGTIGCLLGNVKVPSCKLIAVIGSFLLEVCSKSSDLWVIAEALDVIFDVFAEDHLDKICQEINLVEKLSHLLPILKGKMKQQRKSLGEHLPVVMTARTNLSRFVKYKKGSK